MQATLVEKQREIAVLCRQFGVARLEVFGSASVGGFDIASSDFVRPAREFSAGLTLESFGSNVLVRSAVERQLEILGEACQRMVLTDRDVKRRWPEFGLAIGLRNKIIHGYDRVEYAVVYDTLMRDLPAFEERVAEELAKHPEP